MGFQSRATTVAQFKAIAKRARDLADGLERHTASPLDIKPACADIQAAIDVLKRGF